MTSEKMEELLLKMSEGIAEIKTMVNADYKALYGNGHPGLVEQIKELGERVSTLEGEQKGRKHMWALVSGIAAFVISTVVNILSRVFGR